MRMNRTFFRHKEPTTPAMSCMYHAGTKVFNINPVMYNVHVYFAPPNYNYLIIFRSD